MYPPFKFLFIEPYILTHIGHGNNIKIINIFIIKNKQVYLQKLCEEKESNNLCQLLTQ